MVNNIRRVTDLLSAPIEQVIAALGSGIARAQRELDQFAIATQREIDQDPILSEYGLQATFYQIPRAELDLTIAIAMEEEPRTRATGATSELPSQITRLPRLKQLYLQPINAAYINQFSFDVQASSKIKLTVVPVPPPTADTSVNPNLSQERVLEIARPNLVSGENLRLSVNFNAQARLWFVMQYRIAGDTTTRLALVVIDDATGSIVKSETET
jgi:hypothetical protein